MTPFTLFFAILGVSYVSWLIMKFIVWLDGADEVENRTCPCNDEIIEGKKEQRSAAQRDTGISPFLKKMKKGLDKTYTICYYHGEIRSDTFMRPRKEDTDDVTDAVVVKAYYSHRYVL